MADRKEKDSDIYLARLRQSKEKESKALSAQERKIVNFVQNGPSFNSIFGKKAKKSE